MVSVAIDGPAGAGKSTLARRLAAEMGYIYVDTGAMYRAIGLYALRAGKDPKDNAAVNTLLPQIKLRLASIEGEQHIYLKEEDVSTAIRTEAAGMAASAVGANPAVRAFLLELQRDMAKKQDVLMDGRDIGTVVLPDATVKIFLTATPEARATRRCGSPETGRGRRAAGHLGAGLRAEPCRHEEDHCGEGRLNDLKCPPLRTGHIDRKLILFLVLWKRLRSFPEHAFTRKAVTKNDIFKNCCIVRFRPACETENRINLRNKTTL